jgi:hypothetical protein
MVKQADGSTDDDRGRIVTAASAVFNALTSNGVNFRMGVVPHSNNDFKLGNNLGGALYRKSSFLLDHKHVRRLCPIHSGTIFRLNARQIESLIPPSRDVGRCKPFLKERKVGSFKRSE